MDAPVARAAGAPPPRRTGPPRRLALASLIVWVAFLCFVPDPRPLGAPEWAVAAVRAATRVGEPAARAAATLALRATGLALLGVLWMVAAGAKRWDGRGVAAIVGAPLLATCVLWVNLGYRPIALQIEVASLSAVAGAVARIAVNRRPLTAAGLVVGLGGLFAWGTATGIRDEEVAATRAVGRELLEAAAVLPDGDAGFARMAELAFHFAEVDVRGAEGRPAAIVDPVAANRVAILALSVILGEEKVAKIAGRRVDASRLGEFAALRRRITLQGRKDWPQHFWVSAGLSLLSDADRSIAIGVTKELMDATAGGSGFSFADLAADAAGNRFTRAATRDAASARALQERIGAGFRPGDFVPELRDLPEGITRDDFNDRYGGLGGAETRRIVAEIEARLAACPGLR